MIRRLRILSWLWFITLLLLLGTGVGRVRAQTVPILPRVLVTTELRPFRQGRQWGYVSPSGQVRIRPQYTYAEPFDHGLAKVWQGAHCGFIDAQGHVIVPLRYDRAGYYRSAILPPDPPSPAPPSWWPGGRGLVVVLAHDTVHLDGLFGKENPEELVTGPAAWQDTEWVQLPSAHFWGLYDSLGQQVLPVRYTGIRRRADGLLAAAQVGAWYSGDVGGGDVITLYRNYPLYQEQLFSLRGQELLHGLAYTGLGDIWYGQLIVYDRPDLARQGQYGLVDTARALEPTQWYDEIKPLHVPGFAAATYSDGGDSSPEWVLLDAQGEPRSAQRYVYLSPASPGLAIAAVQQANRQIRVGVLDLASEAWAIRPEYESITYTPTNGYQARQRGRLIGLEDDGVAN